jgi:hypothetical protein
MFDLLHAEFSTEDDQQAAILELKRLRWDPTKTDALPFATFKSKVKSLANRAGYSTWNHQSVEIRECVEPAALRTSIYLQTDEATFWKELHVRSNTFLTDFMRGKCDICGNRHEGSKCRRGTGNPPRGAGGDRDNQSSNQGSSGCDWCAIPGHFKR